MLSRTLVSFGGLAYGLVQSAWNENSHSDPLLEPKAQMVSTLPPPLTCSVIASPVVVLVLLPEAMVSLVPPVRP